MKNNELLKENEERTDKNGINGVKLYLRLTKIRWKMTKFRWKTQAALLFFPREL